MSVGPTGCRRDLERQRHRCEDNAHQQNRFCKTVVFTFAAGQSGWADLTRLSLKLSSAGNEARLFGALSLRSNAELARDRFHTHLSAGNKRWAYPFST